MTVYEQLLVVQDLDTRVDQLEHRRATLPQRAELERNAAAQSSLARDLAEVEQRRDDLVRSQRRLEHDISQIEEKVAHEEKVLYAGTLTNPRELQALQDEIESLRRRQRDLEDDDLEIMEQLEPVGEERDTLTARQRDLEAEADQLEASLAQDEASLAEELSDVRSERQAAAAEIDPAVLDDYEVLRPRLGGVAIARLQGTVCGGCHLSLPAMEVDRLRKLPDDERVTCEECGRLLVR